MSVSEKKLKSVNILAKLPARERGCLMHFSRLANTLLKDEESAQDNHTFACFLLFAFSLLDSAINASV